MLILFWSSLRTSISSPAASSSSLVSYVEERRVSSVLVEPLIRRRVNCTMRRCIIFSCIKRSKLEREKKKKPLSKSQADLSSLQGGVRFLLAAPKLESGSRCGACFVVEADWLTADQGQHCMFDVLTSSRLQPLSPNNSMKTRDSQRQNGARSKTLPSGDRQEDSQGSFQLQRQQKCRCHSTQDPGCGSTAFAHTNDFHRYSSTTSCLCNRKDRYLHIIYWGVALIATVD